MTPGEWEDFYVHVVDSPLPVGVLFPAPHGGREGWRMLSWENRRSGDDQVLRLKFLRPGGAAEWVTIARDALSQEDVVVCVDDPSAWQVWLETGTGE